jgi:hypothetical protein
MWVEKTAAVILKQQQFVPLKHQHPTTTLQGVITKHKIFHHCENYAGESQCL